MSEKELLVIQKGMRLRFKTPNGIKHGTVKELDGSAFPGKIVFVGDDGIEYEIPIEIGLPES